jgi:DNA-binding transcriptional MerR regulator
MEDTVKTLRRYLSMILKTIQLAAVETGLSPGTLREYEKLGLLSPQRDSSGRRLYSQIDVQQAQRIARERQAKCGRGLRNARPEVAA